MHSLKNPSSFDKLTGFLVGAHGPDGAGPSGGKVIMPSRRGHLRVARADRMEPVPSGTGRRLD